MADSSVPTSNRVDVARLQDLPVWEFDWGDLLGECRYLNLGEGASEFEYLQGNVCVLHFNIRSLIKNLGNLRLLLNGFERLGKRIDIVLLCETFLNNVNSNLVALEGYNFFEIHRNHKSGGGVGIYVRDDIPCHINNEICCFDEGSFESLFCDAVVNGKKFLIGDIYRTPNSNEAEYLKKLHIIYNKIDNLSGHKIIGTDQNVDFLVSETNKSSQDVLDANLAHQLVPTILAPTRVTDHTAKLIDNIFVSTSLLGADNCNTAIIVEDISDHFPCLLNFHVLRPTQPKSSTDFYRPCTDSNFQSIKDDLQICNWEMLKTKTANEAYLKFHNLLQHSFNKHCPLIARHTTHQRIRKEKWMTDVLLQRSKELKVAFKSVFRLPRDSHAFQAYLIMRNKYNADKKKLRNHIIPVWYQIIHITLKSYGPSSTLN